MSVSLSVILHILCNESVALGGFNLEEYIYSSGGVIGGSISKHGAVHHEGYSVRVFAITTGTAPPLATESHHTSLPNINNKKRKKERTMTSIFKY